ncbi:MULTISPECIES: putative phage abortive infection protein [Pseudomonas fluorescens group]|jgi:hypothetical protein|nr:putative phage abortive infection protein [Pseudomonas fluorescens]
MKKQYEKPELKLPWHKVYWLESLIAATGLLLMNLIFIAKAYRASDTVDPTTAGQLGDFIGGYFGTIFTLISVVLLFATLRNQRIASQQLYFETKYFELIKMHRDNVAELELSKSKGRKIFVNLIREFREILKITKSVSKTHSQDFSQHNLIHISYYCLFFGTGPNSSRMLKESLKTFNQPFIEDLINTLNATETKSKIKKDRAFSYTPFEGHQSRLGHYYRHLYQTVKYVDQQKLDITKYEYVKTIRAQLSTHEQALLLINSLSPIGEKWITNYYLETYKLVKNIPFNFFDPATELNTESLFSRNYFEWDETDEPRQD